MSAFVSAGFRKKRLAGSWVVLTIFMIALAAPSFAALGASSESIQADQLLFGASVRTIQADAYVIHEMRLPYSTVVREYVSRSNTVVFGVSWQGPFMPDLKRLLGTYSYLYLEAARNRRENHAGYRLLNIRGPSLVLQSIGHMGAFSGRAYDPRLLPPGVSANAIQ